MTSEEWGKREEEDHLRGHFCEKRRGGGVLASSGADDVGPTSGEKNPPLPCPLLLLGRTRNFPLPLPPLHSFFQSNAAVQLRKRKRRRGEGVISASNVAVAVVFARGGGSGEDLQQPRKRKVGSFALPSLPPLLEGPPFSFIQQRREERRQSAERPWGKPGGGESFGSDCGGLSSSSSSSSSSAPAAPASLPAAEDGRREGGRPLLRAPCCSHEGKRTAEKSSPFSPFYSQVSIIFPLPFFVAGLFLPLPS